MTVLLTQMLDLPDAPGELARFLEHALLQPELLDLIDTLQAVHATVNPAVSLAQSLGGNLTTVLKEGLASLPAAQVRALLTQPRLLLDLQEAVLLNGGSYWERLLAADPSLCNSARRMDRRLRTAISLHSTASETSTGRLRLWRWAAIGLSVAAALLLAFGTFLWLRPSAPPAWGLARTEILVPDVDRDVYLARLADAADEWFTHPAGTPRELADQLIDFRRGCAAILLADHKPLPAEDRQWLIGRCEKWAKAITDELTELESGKLPSEVRGEADGTIKKLSVALRDRAKKA